VAHPRTCPVRVALLGLAVIGTGACNRTAPTAAKAPDPAVITSGVAGVLQDEAGQPLGRAKVLACMSTVCFSGRTSADGRFSFPIDSPAAVVIKTEEDLSPNSRRAAAMMPVRLTEPRLVDVGAVHVPTLPEGRSIGPARSDPQTLEVGDGLELTLRRSALTAPLGEVLDDVAARRLPATLVPRYPALAGEDVVAVYALHPFTTKSGAPIAVRVPSSLPTGTRVRFRTISEIDGSFSEPVTGRATGTFVATDSSAGITRLTYLVISREGPAQ